MVDTPAGTDAVDTAHGQEPMRPAPPELRAALLQPRRRMLPAALLVSLVAHVLLLGLGVGGDAQGLPGFGLPWEQRRADEAALRVRMQSLPAANAPAVRADAPAQTPAAAAHAEPHTEPPAQPPAEPPAETPAGTPPVEPASFEVSVPDRAPARDAVPAPTSPQDQAVAHAQAEPQAAILALAPPDRLADPPVPTLPVAAVAQAAAASAPAETPMTTQVAPPRPAPPASGVQAPATQRAEAQATQQAAQLAAQLAARQAEQDAERQAAALAEQRAAQARQAAAHAAAVAVAAAQATAAAAAELAQQQETRRAEAARLEAQRQAEAQQQAAREAAAREAAAREATAREAAAREATAREEAARMDAARQEAQRAEAARQQAQRAETARQDAERQAAAEAEARREARLRAIGRQLDEEAARRDAAAAALVGQGSRLPSSVSTQRRGRLFGRADAHAELVLYAEAWARRIQLNPSFELVRDVVRRPHVAPLVTVAIRADGTVESISFVLSSGLAEVDEGIRRIVHSVAPNPVFPPALARDYDVIEIRRTWHFDMAVRLQ